MKKTDYSSWRRLERVIESSGLTINSFARYVGLPRGENLYQIKRGNYGVSLGVAKKIHAKFPQYPISWLMHGEAESAATPEGDAFVVRIPVYGTLPWRSFRPRRFQNGICFFLPKRLGGLKLHYARTINSERFCSIGSCCCGSRMEKL